MKIAVLTTETLHHAYFVRELKASYSDILIVIETKSISAPFATAHHFEEERETYEKQEFFANKTVKIEDFAKVEYVSSINSNESASILTGFNPDIVLVFGVGKILPNIINLFSGKLVNLHGGDPQEYRGLDSHLWAIYHRDFSSLVVALHEINEKLDDGKIISIEPIPITAGMRLHELRIRTTQTALLQVKKLLEMYSQTGEIKSTHQTDKGRYYSFMPSELKNICVNHFNHYTESLNDNNQ